MNCKININMDNEAFSENQEYELARILRALAHRIEHGPLQYIPNKRTYLKTSVQPLFDINGNKIGECIIE
jgi:hypothetical protein